MPKCGRCGQLSPLIHERRIRLVRDRDLFDQRVLLQLPVRRVDCLNCGRVTERIDWLEPASRLTRRLQVWLESLLRLLPISHVSQLTGLHWHTARQAPPASRGRHLLFKRCPPPVMDEFALHRGIAMPRSSWTPSEHGCWVGHGSREAIRPALNCFGHEHGFRPEAAHVVARYGRDVGCCCATRDNLKDGQAVQLQELLPTSRWLRSMCSMR